MLTRIQKEERVKESARILKENGSILFVDFSGVSMGDMEAVRKVLRPLGATFRIFKKRLIKIALQGAGFDYDPTQFVAQTGVVFIPTDVLSVAGLLQKFSKDLEKQNKKFTVVGGLDMRENHVVSVEEFLVLAKLPSREILLAQLAIALSMPLKGFMYALRSRQEQLEMSK